MWDQVSLSLRSGGFEIRLADELALPAYMLASVCSVSYLVITLTSFSLNDALQIPHETGTRESGCESSVGRDLKRQEAWNIPLVNRKVVT